MRSIIVGILVTFSLNGFSQENIAAARALGVGQTVTITGIVTNGEELGPIRYMQDGTGGLAVYSTSLSGVKRGDEITVTGTLKDYNTLLEMDPVTSFTVNSSGNALPDPVVLTPDEQAEQYESMLVKIDDVVFDASGSFERNSYTYTSNGQSGQIYINSPSSPLVGSVIPTAPVSLVGPLGAHYDTYQILPRDQFDLISSSAINLTSVPVLSDLTTSGFKVSWTTDVAGTTEAFYGNTPAMELGKMTEAGTSTAHMITFSGLDASELIYMQPFSVKDGDTTRAAQQVFITQSESTGEVITYFNNPVDNSVSLGLLDAIYLDNAMDDTLLKYMERATESIDITMYSFNTAGIQNIATALNTAANRGVTVRVVYDSNQSGTVASSLSGSVGSIASPESDYPNFGIMHNKFVVFDAQAADPNKAFVWTGATNFSGGQMNDDPNDVVIVQDKSLAIAYQLEFNEMFGSDGAQPDPAAAKFGPQKADNTPHEFIIGGSRVECYFSPSDGTHGKILETIESADHSIHIATMLITKSDIGYDLADKADEGLEVQVLINAFDEYGEPIVNTLKASLAEDIRLPGEPGIMHHKYMIVDQAEAGSDPMVLLGSHNWSSSAQFRNDENTLIFHDQAVANAYYQEFVKRFSFGQLIVDAPECSNDFVTMQGGSFFRYDVLYNDSLPGPVTVTINSDPSNGTAVVESDQTITYTPNPGFNQAIDTVGYTACLTSSTGICDDGLFVIYVNLPASVDNDLAAQFNVYPVPANDRLLVETASNLLIERVQVLELSGRLIRDEVFTGQRVAELSTQSLPEGIFYLGIHTAEGIAYRKVTIAR